MPLQALAATEAEAMRRKSRRLKRRLAFSFGGFRPISLVETAKQGKRHEQVVLSA